MGWGRVRTAWGEFYAAASARGIVALRFPGEFPPEPATSSSPLVDALARELAEYLEGERTSFDLPLDLVGTPFQRAVWMALREVPYGATVTYGELARRVGRPGAARAVGQAVGANPIPILIPCHRVVPRAGGVGGFGPGPDWKARLLALECHGL